MSVIKHDFGSSKRRAARRLRTSLDLDALHEANAQANPLPYLERASERIYQLEKLLFEAAGTEAPADDQAVSSETIEVSKAEYEDLQRCRDAVRRGLAELNAKSPEEP